MNAIFHEDKPCQVYRAWLRWAQDSFPKSLQPISKKVVGIKGERAALCCEESVRTYFEALQQTLQEIGVLASATATLQHSHRVWACDEKGMTDEAGKIKFTQSLCIAELGPPTCTAGQSSFKHVSVLPFVCLDGRVSEPYIVMSGQMEMNAWQKVWEGAHVKTSEKGAVTTALFAEFFGHWCQWIREKLKIPYTEEILLLLDSGGGSLSHLSVDVGVLSQKYRIRPFYLPPYHTAACMPLDQSPNREYERRWSAIRSKQNSFTPLQTLDAAHECFEAGFNADNVKKGWASVGLTAGLPINRAKVLIERGKTLFLGFFVSGVGLGVRVKGLGLRDSS